MQLLFLSCRKATELIEKQFHFKLSAKEKLQLRIHKMMCEACTNYEKQDNLIEKALKNQQQKPAGKINIDQFKDAVLDKLDNN